MPRTDKWGEKRGKQEKHTELRTAGTDIGPCRKTRAMPMEVLSLGMPRTGTASMQLALDILGYTCYHGLTLIANLQDTAVWNDALDAKFFNKSPLFTKEKWDRLLGGYSAVADLPAIAFADDLIHCYPDARVVLVEKNIDEWYQSFDEEEIQNIWNPTLRLIARLDIKFVGKLGSTSGRWTEGWFKARSKTEMQNKARQKYREHYALVENATPPGRLLKFRLEQGWKPLCAFLGRPVPDIKFPRVNESDAMRREIVSIAWRGFMNALASSVKFLIPIAVLALACMVIGSGRQKLMSVKEEVSNKPSYARAS